MQYHHDMEPLLLDRLLQMPMQDIVADLHLPPHVSDALLHRTGPFGSWLRLAQTRPTEQELSDAGISPTAWWHSQLNAYHWAIQVGRNV